MFPESRSLCPLKLKLRCFETGSGYFTRLISCFLPLFDSFSCPQNKDVFVGCEIYLLRSEWWGNFKLPWHLAYIHLVLELMTMIVRPLIPKHILALQNRSIHKSHRKTILFPWFIFWGGGLGIEYGGLSLSQHI